MKRFSIFDFGAPLRGGFSILLSLCAICVICGSAHAQFIGYAAQQTVTKTFSVASGFPNPTPPTVIPLSNYGQTGHTIFADWSTGLTTCVLTLQVSGDGATWETLAQSPSLGSIVNVSYANGYFPFLQIVVNPNSDAGCQQGVTGTYVGYQIPISIPDNSIVVNKSNIAAVQDIPGSLSTASIIAFLRGFQCHNPGGATAYLQMVPSVLGTNILYQVGIPAGQTFVYQGPTISYASIGWKFGAATAADGAVAFGTALVCSFQLNPFGPFLPRQTF